jgi:hypothetical protein
VVANPAPNPAVQMEDVTVREAKESLRTREVNGDFWRLDG